MDNGEFNPHGFGIGGAAVLAAGIGSAILQAGHNVAEVMAEHRNATNDEVINDSFRAVITSHDDLLALVIRQRQELDEMGANVEVLIALCEEQAAELARR